MREHPAEECQVFVSYSSQDAARAEEVVSRLAERGFRPWLAPAEIRSGQWSNDIYTNLQASAVVLLVLTPGAVASRQVLREIALADKLGKAVIVYAPVAVQLTGGLAYYLAAEQLQADVDVAIHAIEAAWNRPLDLPQKRPLSKRLLLGIVATAFACLYLVIWVSRFTNLELYSIASVGTVTGLITIYQFISETSRRHITWQLTELRLALRPWRPVVPMTSILAVLATIPFGAVRAESQEPIARRPCFESDSLDRQCGLVNAGAVRKFLFGPIWSRQAVSVSLDGFPRLTLYARPLRVVPLLLPDMLLPPHLVLIVPDAIVRGLPSSTGFSVRMSVLRGDVTVVQKTLDVNALRKPAWIGCDGSVQVPERYRTDDALTNVGDAAGQFSCVVPVPLQENDTVSVTVFGADTAPWTSESAIVGKSQVQFISLLSPTISR